MRLQWMGGLALAGLCSGALAQTQTQGQSQGQFVRSPLVQYRMDVTTSAAPGTQGQRSLQASLATQRKPAGTEAVQSIPSSLKLGNTLTLRPAAGANPSATATPESGDAPPVRERVLVYWGCQESVPTDQPRVIALQAAQSHALADWMLGSPHDSAAPRDATLTWAVWPPQSATATTPSIAIARNASLSGRHTLSGEGIPAGMQFTIAPTQNFLPTMALSTNGGGNRALTLGWSPIAAAQGYVLSAIAVNARDYVVWVSAAPTGFDLRWPDYASAKQLKTWQDEGKLLPPQARQCTIPAGIFANTDAGLLQATAYGEELDITYPSRPAEGRAAWLQDWNVRVRVRSVATAPLDANGVVSKEPLDKPLMPAIPGVPVIPDLSGALKGLFGR